MHTKNRIRESRGDQVFKIINTTIVTILLLIVLYPLINVLSCSFSDPLEVGAGHVILLPKGLNILGYKRVFQDPSIMTGYANSLFYTVVGTVINLLVTVPAGYALSKSDLPGRNVIMGYFMFTMYFSGGMIPGFLLVRNLGLYDTRAVLLILGAFSTYNCIICRTFFSSIPKELEEAASIDGCAPIRCFIQIILPISQALLGVMVLYFAVGHWNSYFNAMMYTYRDSLKPLQVILRRILVEAQMSAEMSENMGGAEDYANEQYQLAALIRYAVIVVSSVPVLILYPFLQKYFDQGVMIGSVKG